MILWCDGPHDPGENMRRDQALLERAERLAGPDSADASVVLRLFAFRPHGITLGRAQDPARELDLERCAHDGVSWAVRPTGGRAIFHAQEWTYSLAAAIDHPHWGGSLSEAYGRLASVLLASLRALGVPAALAPGAQRTGAPHRQAGAAAPCFASTARHEIVRGGRKLVGSAQRRTARALLQQGSVLLGEGHARLVDYLRLEPAERESRRTEVLAASTHAGDVLGPAAPLGRWADVLGGLLPPGTSRLEGGAGTALLTPGSPGSYTPASV